MKFKDGKFRILILADIHAAEPELEWTLKHIQGAIDKSHPDLIVLLGDNVTGKFPGITVGKVRAAIYKIGSTLQKNNVPFTLVFGNHDHEGLGLFGFDETSAKNFIMDEFKKFSCCIAQKGEEMTGVGNYNIPVLSSDGKVKLNLWFADSNPYAEKSEGGGYGYVHADQLEWYEKTAAKLKEENDGETVPSFIFQHIIVPESYDMFHVHNRWAKGRVKGHGRFSENYYTVNSEYVYSGNLREGPCPPDVKSRQFDSWLKTGDIIGAFFGHDHINDFSGVYKGIPLHQVPSTGFYSYGYTQGTRVVTVSEEDVKNYSTEIMNYIDVCDVKIKNPFIRKHGYYEWIKRWKPRLGVIGAVTASSFIACAVIKKIR